MRTTVVLLLAAAWGAAVAPAAAQDRAYAPSLSRAEILRSGAPDVYAAVAELRPAWLAAIGDTVGGRGFEELIVYLNGRYAGDVRLLRTLEPELVAGIRYHSPDFIRSVDPRYPRTGFTAALWVSTRTGNESVARSARRTVTVYGVAPVHGMSAALSGALAEAGYSRELVNVPDRTIRVEQDAPRYTPGIGLNAGLGLTPTVGIELQAEHVFPTSLGRFDSEGRPVGATFSWTDAVLMATYRQWPGRFGAGPILRGVQWTWGEGLCGCWQPESSTSIGYGVAGSASTLLSVGGSAVLEARIGLRYFFSHEVPAYRSVPALDLSGPEAVLSFGVGLHR